ncbi:MAG: HlyD family efflux transporter periplasmic adaptor subunit, partial [Peptostreptococcaceae bacterium]
MKKLKYSRLLILGILVYIVFNGVTTVISKNIKTEVLKNEKTEMKISRECLIIREEYILKADTKGTLNLLVNEGEKITKSQEVANIYSNIDKNIDKDINKLNEEIEKLENGEINISKDEISQTNLKIDEIINEIQEDLLANNY